MHLEWMGCGISRVIFVASITVGLLAVGLGAQTGTPPRPAVSLTQAPLTGTVWPADLNRDGRADLIGSVRGTFNAPGALAVAVGNGNGTFTTAQAVSSTPMTPLVPADFNKDGATDILAVEVQTGDGYLVAGRGDGAFAAPTKVISPLASAGDVLHAVEGDFDGNGTRDVAITGEHNSLDIYPGQGDLTFGTPVRYPTDLWASGLAIGDLNGDNRLDLAVGTRYGFAINVFINQGSLLFNETSIPFPTAIAGVTAWDLNGDRRLELIAVSGDSDFMFRDTDPGTVYVLRGNGDGTFQPAASYPTLNGPMFVVGGDFNRDGLADVATGNWSDIYDPKCDGFAMLPQSVSILPGNGTGALGSAVSFATGPTPDRQRTGSITALKTTDLNGDGRTDLISSHFLFINAAGTTNRVPTVNAGQDGPGYPPPDNFFQGMASDPDHHWVDVEWTDAAGRVIGVTPTACVSTRYEGLQTFTFTGDDRVGGVASDTVTRAYGSSTGSNSVDIGTVAAAGSSATEGSMMTVTGSGADIWSTADEFHFASQVSAGDFDFAARVLSVSDVHRWTKAGLMIRETYDPGSRHISLFATPSAARGIALQYRPTTNGESFSVAGPAIGPPAWLRLSRRGDRVRAYYSSSGSSAWSLIGEQTLAGLPSQVLVGFAVASHVDGTLATARFDVAELIPAALESSDIGSVGVAGTTVLGPTTLTVEGGGTDIWGTADAFRYVYQRASGDAEISVRINSVEATHAWAKAGVMLRESLTPGSKHVMAVATPGKGVALQYRPSTTALSVQHTVVSGAAPGTLRLRRDGDQFTATWYGSGGTVAPLASVTVPMATEIYVGIPVTSHNNATVSTAVFTDIWIVP